MTTAKIWRAVIIDDERLARNQLRAALEAHTEIEVVGEADGAKTAFIKINETKPDVIFLDIQMPGASGFELLEKITHACKVIFVTAFDEYAIRAFEVNALDYILKPINPQRLSQAIERLSQTSLTQIKTEIKPLTYEDFIFINSGESSRFLKVSSIVYIRAAGVYSEVITHEGNVILIHKPLNEWEERLPERQFTRIHRSTIINLSCVNRIERWFNNSYQVYLLNIKEPLTLSRRYATKLKDKLQ